MLHHCFFWRHLADVAWWHPNRATRASLSQEINSSSRPRSCIELSRAPEVPPLLRWSARAKLVGWSPAERHARPACAPSILRFQL